MTRHTKGNRMHRLGYCLSIIVLAAACGGGAQESTTTEAESPDQSPTSDATPDATEAGANVPEGFEELYEAALGDDTFVWVISFGGSDSEGLLAEFEATFPGVDGEILAASGSETAVRLVTLLGAGESPDFDVSFAPPTIASTLVEADAFLPVDWADVGVNPELLVDVTEGNGVHFIDSIYVLSYNTDLVDEADLPASWVEVADFTAGPIMADPRGVSHGQMAIAYDNDLELAYEVAEQMLERDLVLPESSGLRFETVSSGAAVLGFGDHLRNVLTLKESGAPIDWIPTESVSAAPFYAYIPRGAANENAAKLFIAWLASNDGARQINDRMNQIPAIVEGGFESPEAALLAEHGVELKSQLDLTPEELVANAELRDRVAELFAEG